MENITINNFKEIVLNSKKPVLIKFHALWCSSCQTLTKVTTGIESEINDKAIIGEVDIEKEKELTKLLNIKTVPTIVVFNNGKIINHHVGLLTKKDIINLIP